MGKGAAVGKKKKLKALAASKSAAVGKKRKVAAAAANSAAMAAVPPGPQELAHLFEGPAASKKQKYLTPPKASLKDAGADTSSEVSAEKSPAAKNTKNIGKQPEKSGKQAPSSGSKHLDVQGMFAVFKRVAEQVRTAAKTEDAKAMTCNQLLTKFRENEGLDFEGMASLGREGLEWALRQMQAPRPLVSFHSFPCCCCSSSISSSPSSSSSTSSSSLSSLAHPLQGLPIGDDATGDVLAAEAAAAIGQDSGAACAAEAAGSAAGDGLAESAPTEAGSEGKGQMERAVLNSVTCPAAWAAFSRCAKNRKKWPVTLAPELKSDKQSLFETWLACNRDLEKLVEVVIKKRASKETENDNEWQFRKKRDILPMYGGNAEKVDKVCKYIIWIPDEALPDDVEERWYRVRVKVAHNRREKTEESFGVEGRASVDDRIAQHLMGEGGALGDNISVNLMGASESEMSKFLVDASKAEGVKVQRIKPRELKEGPADKAEADPLEEMKGLMPKMLDQAAKARTYGNSIVHRDHGQSLGDSMKAHGIDMENKYAQCAALVKEEKILCASRLHPA